MDLQSDDAELLRRLSESSPAEREEQVRKLTEASAEPSGVVATAADGRLFFLAEEEAQSAEIPHSGLYEAYRRVSERDSFVAAPSFSSCKGLKRWLDSHSPHSARWRRLCLVYFETCV